MMDDMCCPDEVILDKRRMLYSRRIKYLGGVRVCGGVPLFALQGIIVLAAYLCASILRSRQTPLHCHLALG